MKKTIAYYAVALNSKNQIEQLFVTRENGKAKSQEWTGIVYKTKKDAIRDLVLLNCES